MLKNAAMVAATLGLIALSAVADGPVVPGVQSCTIETGGGGTIELSCPWDTTCCAAPVYGQCPGAPQQVCLLALHWTCCSPLEDCWYQQRGGKFFVWCGDPFPPD